jgi:hypothetical protein
MQRILKYHLLLDKLISETQLVSTAAHSYVARNVAVITVKSVSCCKMSGTSKVRCGINLIFTKINSLSSGDLEIYSVLIYLS